MNSAGGSADLAMLRAAVLAVATWSLGAAFASAPAAGPTETKAPYRLGVSPYLPTARLEEAYAPAAADFAKALGREILLRTKTTFAAVSHLTKIALIEAGFEPGLDVAVKHFKNDESCLQQIDIESANVCGTSRTVVRIFTAMRPIQLRELSVTRAMPHVLYTVHLRVSKEDRESLKRVILAWHKTKGGGNGLEV